jgi:hypothetical protein
VFSNSFKFNIAISKLYSPVCSTSFKDHWFILALCNIIGTQKFSPHLIVILSLLMLSVFLNYFISVYCI